MAGEAEWKASVTATSRFDNVQKIQAKIDMLGTSLTDHGQVDAFSAELSAYDNSTTREAYDAAVDAAFAFAGLDPASQDTSQARSVVTNSMHTPLQEVGPYKECHHVASGMTSQVYKSHKFALKVITETHNIEPHDPGREIKLLRGISHPSIIELLKVDKDIENRLILVFPYMPFDLAAALNGPRPLLRISIISIFRSIFSALGYLHGHGIIHRDVKPSNILLSHMPHMEYLSGQYEVRLIDFGTAWHPQLSTSSEPAHHKVLEVGTTCYRAPETLFGDRSYGTSLDLWATGCILAECLRFPTKPLFESRSTEEDGNQLGLILSMFKTLGTPTKESWPEAVHFSTPPFEWYQSFPRQSWDDLLPNVDEDLRLLVASLVQYESGQRSTATEALKRLDGLDE